MYFGLGVLFATAAGFAVVGPRHAWQLGYVLSSFFAFSHAAGFSTFCIF